MPLAPCATEAMPVNSEDENTEDNFSRLPATVYKHLRAAWIAGDLGDLVNRALFSAQRSEVLEHRFRTRPPPLPAILSTSSSSAFFIRQACQMRGAV